MLLSLTIATIWFQNKWSMMCVKLLNHFKPVDGHNALKIYSKNPLRLSLHHLQRPVVEANQRKSTGQILKSTVHPWKLTLNIIMEVWKIMFLSKWVICRFHVNLPGCKTNDPNHDLLSMNHCSLTNLKSESPSWKIPWTSETNFARNLQYHNHYLSQSISDLSITITSFFLTSRCFPPIHTFPHRFFTRKHPMYQASVTAPEPLRAGGNSELRLETVIFWAPRNGRK